MSFGWGRAGSMAVVAEAMEGDTVGDMNEWW